ncbi:NAD(P)H-dependent oxidoreductase [soil metagenome]
MQRIKPETIVEALKWRYATKQFDPTKKIDPAIWEVLEQTLVLCPSSFGLQPWKFIVITNQEIKDQLVPVSWGQKQIADASHLVVLAVQHPLAPEHVRKHIARTAELHGKTVEDLAGFEKVINGFIDKPPFPLDIKEWSTRQVYLAFGSFMTVAALLGVDTCPMEGLDPAKYDKILGLEGSGFFTVAACPAGYRSEEDKYAKLPKVRHEDHHVLVRHL